MSDLVKLDQKDRRILYQLESNCRMPLSQLAKQVSLSREVVNYRIRQLEKKGVIEYYVATIDLVKLGLMYCRTFYRYNHVSSEIENQMIEYARKNPHISWMALGDGDMNLALVYIVKNINAIQSEYFDFLFRFGNYFRRQDFSVAFQIYHYKHSYLYQENDRFPVIVGGHKGAIKIDDLDFKILLELMKNPRVNLLDMEHTLKTSVKTVNKRMKDLMGQGVILGFRAKINPRVLNYEHHKVFLFLEDLTREKLNLIISYLSQSREVIFITIPLGNAHLEFEIIVEGKVKLFEFMRNLSINFPTLIKDYESALLYSEPFTNYLPHKESIE